MLFRAMRAAGCWTVRVGRAAFGVAEVVVSQRAEVRVAPADDALLVDVQLDRVRANLSVRQSVVFQTGEPPRRA